MTYTLNVLQDGYSTTQPDDSMRANGTCSLLTSSHNNIIVDTLGPWDCLRLQDLLALHALTPADITHVVCTHGHPDHTGNNNLFTEAKLHIVGHSVFKGDLYYNHSFDEGVPYDIDEWVSVIPTPGHTLDSLSVVVTDCKIGDDSCSGTPGCCVVIAGDLFEREGDILDSSVWKEAGSEDEKLQIQMRQHMSDAADYIVPGHGSMFRVTDSMKSVLIQDVTDHHQSMLDSS